MLRRCGCGLPIAMRTSWMRENLGRKFRACKFYNHETGQRGCNSLEWIGPEPLYWQRDVTNILVVEKHRIAADNHILRSRSNCDEHENKRLMEEDEESKKKKSVRKEMAGGYGLVVKEHGNKSSLLMCVLVSIFVSFVFVKIFGLVV